MKHNISKEEYYDENIAPKLAGIAEECKENGMSFVASCAYDNDTICMTTTLTKDCGFAMNLVRMAASCSGNVDQLLMQIINHAHIYGHKSAYLKILGVPENEGESKVDHSTLLADLVAVEELARLAPELNPSNYDHDDVCRLNDAMCELYEIVREYRPSANVTCDLRETKEG